MKRFTIVLMLCALMMSLLLSACGTTDNTDDGDIGMTNAESQGDPSVEHAFITAKTYDEYQALILQQERLPENFDHFDNFAYLGEFQEFRTWHPFAKVGYHYDIVDQAQIELKLSVRSQGGWAEKADLSDTDINPTDMRTLPSKQKGTYEINGLTYHYAMGELLCISWWRDGMYYALSPELKGDYPIEASTVYAKLLNIQGEDYPLMCALLLSYEKS